MKQFLPTTILVTPEDMAILKLLSSMTPETKMRIHDFLLENETDFTNQCVM